VHDPRCITQIHANYSYVSDSKQPIAREEYLGEAFSDGEDDQELSDGEEERVKKWQKGLAKAKAPRETITTYQ
jgi:hypothetical protein